jgi:NADPH:quinone reductase-like Zn-dependent oxidoreductase
MPSQHTVYRLSKGSSENKISSSSEPIPSPTKHEVLIKIKALALNYRDVAVKNNTYPFPVTDNVVPVSDCAGVVESVGEGVDTFKAGDKVVVAFDGTTQYGPQRNWKHGHGAPVDGFLREYATVPASMLVKVPESSELNFPELASLVCTGVTAWNALFGAVSVRPGQTILVQGKSDSAPYGQ